MYEYKLKSCPFCGFRRPVILTHKKIEPVKFSVKCDLKHGGCGVETRKTNYKEDAVNSWNMRAFG